MESDQSSQQQQCQGQRGGYSGQQQQGGRPIPGGRPQFNRTTTGSTGSNHESRSYRPNRERRSASGASPWEGTTGFHQKPADFVPLTETGYEFPFKKALLARYRPDATLPQAKLALLRANDDLARAIWVEEAQRPVSFESFSEDEQKAVASGNFCNFHKKPHHNQQGPSGSQQQQQPQQQKARFNRQIPAQDFTQYGQSMEPVRQSDVIPETESDYFARRQHPEYLDERPIGRSIMSETRRKELEKTRTFDVAMEERFSAPLNSRKTASPTHDALAAAPSKVAYSLSDLDNDADPLTTYAEKSEAKLMQAHYEEYDYKSMTTYTLESATTSFSAPIQPVANPVTSATSSFFAQFMNKPVGLPVITQTTQWLYRDPAGQVQGPFSNAKMLDWYTRAFFPENLPLRRQEDPTFEPLFTWKSDCGGKAPFALAAVSEEQLKQTRSAQLQSTSSPLAGFFDLNLNLSAQASPNPAKTLSDEESRFLSQLGLLSVTETKKDAPIQSQTGPVPVKSAPVPQAGPAWGAVPQVRPAKLDEPTPSAPKVPIPPVAPTRMDRPLVPASSSGWCKPPSPSAARPLEEILAEEERQAAARPKPSASAPKSFADLMKGQTVSASSPQLTKQPVKPAVAPVTNVTTKQGLSLIQWTTEQLRPLTPVYDVDTCVNLIMSCGSPDDTASFVRENLRTDRINMPAFLQSYIQRRWGPNEAQRFLPGAAGSASGSTTGFEDEAFVTVDRRKAKK